MTADRGCVWMYGVAGHDLEAFADRVAGVGGVGGSPPRTVTAAGLSAIVGDVGDREYGEAPLRRNLEDLDWLAQTARAHHAVLEAVAERGPVVPMRLATLFSSDAGVTGTLQERADDFRKALSLIRARREWGVKAYAVKPADPAGEPGREGPATGPGAAYLQRRRAQLTASKDARAEALASARTVYAELSRFAVSSRLYPPQAPDLAGQQTPMVLNAAYLVADERADEFAAVMTDLTARHRFVQLTLTGPWPAYSFVGEGDGPGQR